MLFLIYGLFFPVVHGICALRRADSTIVEFKGEYGNIRPLPRIHNMLQLVTLTSFNRHVGNLLLSVGVPPRSFQNL